MTRDNKDKLLAYAAGFISYCIAGWPGILCCIIGELALHFSRES